MKALILAAGIGSRLASVTNDSKVLVKVNGITNLERISKMCMENGINNIVVVTGHQRQNVRNEMDRISKKHSSLNFTEVYNPVYKIINNIASVAAAHLELISDNEGFVHFDGDLLIEPALLKKLIDAPGSNLLVVENSRELKEEEMKVKCENGKIVKIQKEIDPKEADGEYIGLYKLDGPTTKYYMECLQKHLNNGETKIYYDNVLPDLLEKFQMSILPTDGLKWVELDFPEDLEEAKKIFST